MGDGQNIAQFLKRGVSEARAGRKQFARRAFEHVLSHDPESVEALLWLAALASEGETSLRYLARVLEIDPRNPRAHAGLRWARKRITKQPTVPHARRVGERHALATRRIPLSPTSLIARLSDQTQAIPVIASTIAPPKRVLPTWQWAMIVLFTACGIIAGGILMIDPLLGESVQAAAPLEIVQIQIIATQTSTATPTASATATATDTSQPSATPTSTSTPTASDTPQPTATATIPPPTATAYVPAIPIELRPAGVGASERWIDINLTRQLVSAYEGDALIRHFIVSTGLPTTPTVTGQFRVYLRYDSQTMSGAGYYLPNVKWVQYFYQGYAIHGTYWHNNFGQPMSHGCVNFTEVEAKWLYDWASYGTLVNVHY